MLREMFIHTRCTQCGHTWTDDYPAFFTEDVDGCEFCEERLNQELEEQ